MPKAPDWDDYAHWLGPLLVDRTQISDQTPGQIPEKTAAPLPRHIVTDSRNIKPGDWYLPLRGQKFDGHEFIPQALAAGAAGFFFDHNQGDTRHNKNMGGVALRDCLAGLQAIAKGWRATFPNLKVIAITGSSGKTTTKELTRAVLAAAAPVMASSRSFNNEIGVPLTLLQLADDHRFCVVECGARKGGDIRFLLEICQPDINVLLNVGSSHVGIFGSQEALLAAKLEMFRYANPEATLVGPYDDPRIRPTLAGATKSLSFGFDSRATVSITEEAWHTDGRLAIRYLIADGPTSHLNRDIEFPEAHATTAINIAAAYAIGVAAGIPPAELKTDWSDFPTLGGRFKVHSLKNCLLIDDAYNANPDSMGQGLVTLTKSYPGRRYTLILGDMRELGASSTEAHLEIGAQVARTVKPEILITVGEEARQIANGALTEGFAKERVRTFADLAALEEASLPLTSLAEIIYVKGSNAIGLHRLTQTLLTADAAR